MLAIAFALAACGRVGFDDAATPDAGGPLALTSDVTRVNFNSRLALSPTGGTPPYTFSIVSGGGTIDEAGVFHAPLEEGEAVVQVSDARGDVQQIALAIGGEFLYAFGGYDDDVRGYSEVWRSTNAIDWTVVGHLPKRLGAGGLWVQDDTLFYAGGAEVQDGFNERAIYRSRDGVTWEPAGELPDGRAIYGHAIYKDRIWFAPGADGDNGWNTDVITSADGLTWETAAPFPFTIHNTHLVVHDGRLWSIAGHGETAQADHVFVTDGGGWTQVGVVPAPGEYHGVAAFAGRMWAAGGNGLKDRVVYSTDGITWLDAMRFPIARENGELVVFQGKLWVIGGEPRTIWSTADGTAWTSVGQFPEPVDGLRLIAFSPRE